MIGWATIDRWMHPSTQALNPADKARARYLGVGFPAGVITTLAATAAAVASGSTRMALWITLSVLWGALTVAFYRRGFTSYIVGLTVALLLFHVSAVAWVTGGALSPFIFGFGSNYLLSRALMGGRKSIPMALATLGVWTIFLILPTVGISAPPLSETPTSVLMGCGFGWIMAFWIAVQFDHKMQRMNLTRIFNIEEDRKVARKAAATQAAFLATMSHELRTPMNGIIGTVDLLKDSPLDADQRGLLGILRGSTDSLLVLLNDILDHAKLESGAFVFESVAFEPQVVLDTIIGLYGPAATKRGLTLQAVVDEAVPKGVAGDSARLQQILRNLVGNALKFTERGSVTIRMTAPQPGIIRIEVIDTGVGLSEVARGRLFARFAQADASINRRFGGTGLGLSICRQLAEGMGGLVGVESVLGAGSTFWLELPMPTADLPKALAVVDGGGPVPHLAPLAGASLNVLVAEDNDVNRRIVARMIKRLGHRATLVEDGQEAVDRLRKTPNAWDVVLMDGSMPVMDGVTAIRLLRANPATADLPIIAFTASAFAEDRARFAEAGSSGFLPKPVRSDDLSRALQDAVRSHGGSYSRPLSQTA